MNELQKVAEILVECGYATRLHIVEKFIIVDSSMPIQMVKPFSDTLEGRRQADAIEDWLVKNHRYLYRVRSGCQINNGKEIFPYHQWRLDCIKWCLQELIKNA